MLIIRDLPATRLDKYIDIIRLSVYADNLVLTCKPTDYGTYDIYADFIRPTVINQEAVGHQIFGFVQGYMKAQDMNNK